MTNVDRSGPDGNIVTTTADFSEKGVEKWKIVTSNGAGQVVNSVEGKNTRVQK